MAATGPEPLAAPPPVVGALAEVNWQEPPGRGDAPPTPLVELRRFDRLLAGVVVALTLISVAALPGQPLAIRSSNLDLVLNTLTALAAAGAAALAWIRYRIERELSAVYECSAFLVLFSTRALLIGIALGGHPERIGLSLEAPAQWPIYAWTLARVATAILLILAAAASLHGTRRFPVPVVALTIGPAALVLAAIAMLPAIEMTLPRLVGPSVLDTLRGSMSGAVGMDPPGLAIQALVALFYLRGAQLYRDSYRQRGRRYAGYISIALLVAAFSQLHWAILPGIYQGIVTADDLLRATFSVILLLGIDAQSRADVRALRLANARLHALRRADADRAALEASARLAREVHDGLSQDLWLAKLKQGRLDRMPGLSGEARGLVGELGDAIDRALVGARSVLATMRGGTDAASIAESLERAADDFTERSGIRTAFTSTGTPPALPSRTTAELLRIVTEAMTNVQKHADATVVRVAATWSASAFSISVTDNGRGFDPTAADPSTYGIRGMRERAQLIGGEVEIVSRPKDGTQVTVRVGNAPGASAPGASAS